MQVPRPGDVTPGLPSTEGFKPIWVTEIEIGQPLTSLQPGADATGRPYERALALVRLHDRPLGTVQFVTSPEGTSVTDVAARIWHDLRVEIDTHLVADGLPPAGTLDTNGILSEGVPECLVARERFLAEAPFASIVVATRDRPDSLERCLQSLQAQVYPAFEIVVVDNAPRTDATAAFFAAHFADSVSVRYVREDRPGLASAHNRGVRELAPGSQYVAFTDDDVVADRYWLCELMRGFEAAENVGCVNGMIFPAELETRPQLLIEQFGGFNKGFRRQVYDIHANRPDDRLFPYAPGRFGSGANMAFRTETLNRIGGFDPAMGTGTPALGGDDLAAFFRVIVDGYTLVYEPAAIVRHTHYRDYPALRKQIYGYGGGLTAYLTKSLFDRPRLALDLAKKLPLGIHYALSSRSGKNVKKGADYPDELTRLERRGMAYGPIAYLRSRRAARRFDRQLTPPAPLGSEPGP